MALILIQNKLKVNLLLTIGIFLYKVLILSRVTAPFLKEGLDLYSLLVYDRVTKNLMWGVSSVG